MPSADALTNGDALLQFLATRDVGCPACGYNLRQLRSPRCPECGQELRLSVGLVDQRIAAWVACLLGCCLPGALGCVVLFTLLYSASEGRGGFGYVPWQVALMLLYLFAMIPASIYVMSTRRRFLRRSAQTQRLLGAAPWVLMGLLFIVVYNSA
jgi:hypothetical protein